MDAYRMQILWLILLVIFAVVEGATVSLVSIWFCAGAAAALVSSYFTASALTQAAVFVVVSCVVLLLLRPYARKKAAVKRTPTNAERIVGRSGRVVKSITPRTNGRVRVEGVDWNARAEESLPEDTLVVVKALEGTTLVVERLSHEK